MYLKRYFKRFKSYVPFSPSGVEGRSVCSGFGGTADFGAFEVPVGAFGLSKSVVTLPICQV